VSRAASKASSYQSASAGAPHQGALKTSGRRFALVAARFNAEIVDRLIAGAWLALREAGAADADVELFRCPGAMELAGLARRVADTGRFDGIACLGAVIRGGTPHFDLVAGEAARGIGALAAEGRIPVAFGVLACDTLEQALERSGADKTENRGYDAAVVAIEMADLYAGLRAGGAPVALAPDIPRRS
jgi:6,7-dimethyl-8-ribityllumazine synthase